MSALPKAIRETIAGWLDSEEIEVFIGYEPASTPLRATPTFVRTREDVARLIWDATCENNLAAFLPNYRGKKVGIMVKGCDSRAVVGLLQEGQLVRENLRIVGVSCPGVVDVRKVADRLGIPVEDIDDACLEGSEVVAGEERLPVSEVLFDICQGCTQHNPIISDVKMGDDVPDDPPDDPFAHVRAMEAQSADERWAWFTRELERCNLCFACRNACPLCYCNVCFADRTQPRWFNQTAEPEDKQFYQIMRTFHLAGRCVGCGACSRACPQGLNLRLLLDKLRLDVLDLFDYTAGVDMEAKPPLTTYREDDANDFVM